MVNSLSLENGVLTGKIKGEDKIYTLSALGPLEALCYDPQGVTYVPTATFSSPHNATAHGPCIAHIPLATKPYGDSESLFWTLDGAAFRETGPGGSWVAQYFFPHTWIPPVIGTDSTRHQCDARSYHLQQRLVNVIHPPAFVFSAEPSDPLDTLVLRSKKVNRVSTNSSQTGPEYANIKKISLPLGEQTASLSRSDESFDC
ncbi:hypothetical protein [Candidatus Hepatobacter penaei]|uniref:hypothetical protein n=1 Tax=Candidatus Hepatobacter penaei TaxID=1274402 RepID=UPI0012E07715|nr:hypothetical protein [Candidatus Hepatobacter penaei]